MQVTDRLHKGVRLPTFEKLATVWVHISTNEMRVLFLPIKTYPLFALNPDRKCKLMRVVDQLLFHSGTALVEEL